MRNLKCLRLYCSSFVSRIILMAGFLAPVFVKAQIIGNYTIDSRQPTANRNFESFTDAIIAMRNGVDGNVTFEVATGSGPYNEQISMDYRIRATATKQVIFNCNGETLTFLSTNGMARAGIKMDSVDYVTINNLKIVPTGIGEFEYGVGIHILHDADHNTIRNCTIVNQSNISVPQNNEGIVINGSDDFSSSHGASNCDSNLITNNTISGGNAGITISAVPINGYPDVFVKGNQIINNKISDASNSGIYLLYNDNTLVQGNDITGGPHAQRGTGITCFELNTNMRIIGNKIHRFYVDPAYSGNPLIGINFGRAIATPGNVNLVANNLIYDFSNTSDQYGIVAQYGGTYLNIYHNTISFEDRTFTGTGSTRGIFTDDFSNTNIMNNIISITRATTGRNYGIYMANNLAVNICDRNLFYLPNGSTVTNAVGYHAGSTQSTLAGWQTRTGKDVASVVSNPKFKDSANFILIPTDSAIDNLGKYAGVNNDIAGAVRNNDHPDIGAYEFLTPKCIGPVLAGSTTMLPGTTICEYSPMYLNLTGNTFGTEQSYQWQTSTTINGTYTNVGPALVHPAYTTTATTSFYYRVAVTCGSLVEYSTPIQINVTPALPAGTYTINSAQATGGTNFQTYADAINSIRCGIRGPVVFNVVAGSGPYREQVIVPRINNTSSTNTVTFNGNGTTIAFLATTSAERALIKLNGARNFIFDNIKINPEAGASGYGVGIQILNDADKNTIRNCTITMNNGVGSTDLVGIAMSASATSYTNASAGSYCDSNTITGNTIIGGNLGITCTSSATALTEGNVITNNIIKDFRSSGMWVTGTHNALIEGNDISRPTRTASLNTPSNGIFMDGAHRNLLVSKNKIHDLYTGAKTSTNTANGIFSSGTDAIMAEPIIISNNLIYNMSGNGAQNALFNSDADSVQYYHNTVSLEDVTSTASGTNNFTKGFSSSSMATGLVLKNNIIVIRRGGTGTKHAVFIADASTTITSDNNDLVNTAAAGTNNFIGRINGADYRTIDLWKQNSANDANSLSVNPLFQNAAAVDFTPTEITLDNKGTPVGITTDINNKTRRVTKPDIGAIEFKVCLLLGPGPNVRVDGETTTTVSFGWDAVTNATGYVVSTDGVNYVQPSSGINGLTHIVTGLVPGSDVKLYVAAMGTADDCDSAKANVTGHALCLTLGAAPVAKVDTATNAIVQFSWTATPNATAYKVSTDGVNFVTPSSGAAGLTHTITTGLTPNSDISLTVRAEGLSELCPKQTSNQVTAHVPAIKFFVPNTFTPNRNGRNDYFTVQSYAISTMHLMIFNQWGQKIFETSSQTPGWDGTWNGKPQPVGVYVYALTMTMQDGTTVNKKGTINLIR